MSESIYNLVPREYEPPVKPPMYRSKHDPNGPLTGSTFGCKGSTRLPGAGTIVKMDGALFGPSKLAPTTSSLKRSASPEKSSDGQFKYSDRLKPSVPSKENRPVMGIHTSKNFVTANAVEAILAAPKVVKVGEPNYMLKEDYGKIPAYLTQVKEEIRRENEMIDKYVKERLGVQERDPERLETMDEYERQELIAQLKAKWDATNAQYQKMTHLVKLDSYGKIRRKEELENLLKQLESDIEKLERHGPILVRQA